MSRKAAREQTFKIVFECEYNKQSYSNILNYHYETKITTDSDKIYISDIVSGVFKNLEAIDGYIIKHSKGWKIDRISKVSLAVLRLCIFEMLYREDIPISVSINEALELLEKYEGIEAKPFVNGILGSIDKGINVEGAN